MSDGLTDFTFEELASRAVAGMLLDWSGDSGAIDNDELADWTGFRARGSYRGLRAIGLYTLTKNIAHDPHFDLGEYLSERLLEWCRENHGQNLPIDAPANPVV